LLEQEPDHSTLVRDLIKNFWGFTHIPFMSPVMSVLGHRDYFIIRCKFSYALEGGGIESSTKAWEIVHYRSCGNYTLCM
jgi:hypothetical protein